MRLKSTNIPAGICRALCRLFWLTMLAGHLPALNKRLGQLSGDTESQLPAVILLVLANLFFFLKLCNVRWIRFRVTAKSFFVLTMIVALMHSSALQRFGNESAVEQPLVVANLMAVGTLIIVRRFIRHWIERIRAATAPDHHTAVPGSNLEQILYYPQLVCIAHRSPRAPPAC